MIVCAQNVAKQKQDQKTAEVAGKLAVGATSGESAIRVGVNALVQQTDRDSAILIAECLRQCCSTQPAYAQVAPHASKVANALPPAPISKPPAPPPGVPTPISPGAMTPSSVGAATSFGVASTSWCESTYAIWKSNPAFFGTAPIDAMREHGCNQSGTPPKPAR